MNSSIAPTTSYSFFPTVENDVFGNGAKSDGTAILNISAAAPASIQV